MTIGKSNVPLTEILLGIITFCVGVIMFFFYGVVEKVDTLAESMNKNQLQGQKEHSEINRKIDTFVLTYEYYKEHIDENTDRSKSNELRLDVVEDKIGLY